MLNRKCLDCGESYGDSLFLWISDDLWEKIGCKREDFLCAHCIINRLEKISSYAYLIGGVGHHTIQTAHTKISMEQNGGIFPTEVHPLRYNPISKKIIK